MLLTNIARAEQPQQQQHHLVFRHVGGLLHANNVIHLTFQVDLSAYQHRCTDLHKTNKEQQGLFMWPPAIKQGYTSPAVQRAYNTNSRLINNICREVEQMAAVDPTRNPRQAALISGLTAFHRQLHQSCLGALFAGDVHHAQELCPTRLNTDRWVAEPMSNGSMALFFRDRTNGQVSCPGGARTNIALYGTVVIPLAANCTLIADDLRVTARNDALLRQPIIIQLTWNVSTLLLGESPKQLLDLQRQLAVHHQQPASSVGDLLVLERRDRELADLRRAQDGDLHQHHLIGGFAIAAAVAALLCIIGCGIRCLSLRRRVPA